MPVFWGILVWCCFFSIMFTRIIKKGVKGIKKERLILISILFSFIPLIFFASMRSVVSDTAAYTNFYNQIPTEMSRFGEYVASMNKDRVFWGLSMLFKCFISENYHIWFFFITIICCIIIAKIFSCYSVLPMLSASMFILTCNFHWLFNGMRQFLAVCITFYAFKYIVEKDLKKYLILIVLASLIHASAIIMIPIYFICRGEIGNKRMLIIMFVFVLVIMNLNRVLPVLDDYLYDTEYSSVISQFSSDDGVNKIKVLISLVPIFLFLFFKKYYKYEMPEFIKIVFNLSIMNVIIMVLGTLTSGIYVGRLSIYFELYLLILYPWIFKNLLKKNNYIIIMASYILSYSIYYYYQMVITWDGFGYFSDVLNINLR